MNITGVGLNDAMLSQATSMKGDQVILQLSVAVMKQMQDQQQAQAAALLKMMAESGIGQNVNLSA